MLAALASGLARAQTDAFPVATPFSGASLLIVDQERLFSDSLVGQEILARNAQEAELLRQEGARLDREFEAEELSLTERRKVLSPEEFRTLADAFDEKVVRTRAAQQERSTALAERVEFRQVEFLNRVGPILVAILAETGAAAVIDERATLVTNEDLNITDEVIKRLDEAYLAEQGEQGAQDEQEN